MLAAIWGGSFLCIEIALAGLTPLSIAALRIALGAAALLAVAQLRGDAWPRGSSTWALLIAAGALNSALPFYLIGWGQQHVSSGLSAVLMSTSPIVALLVAHFATADERIDAVRLLGVALGFCGVLVLIGVDLLEGLSAAVLGQFAIMLASVSYVTSAVLTKRITGVTPMRASGLLLGITAVYLLPLALWLQPPALYPGTPAVWAAIAFLGLVSTGIAYLLRYQLIQSAGVTFLSQVAYLVPVFALLWGWLFIAEVPAPRTGAALVLILAGVYIPQRWAHAPVRS